MSKFRPTTEFTWIDPKEFNLYKYTSSSSKVCLLEFDFEDPKESPELRRDYPLAPDNIETEREMLSIYQLNIADFYNIPIGIVKQLATNFFDKENCVLYYENLKLYLGLGLKLKKLHRVLEFNQS